MVDVKFFYKKININLMINFILELPDEIKPLYFSSGERLRDKNNLLNDHDKLSKFMKHNNGFYLIGNKILYDISPGDKYLSSISLSSKNNNGDKVALFHLEIINKLINEDFYFGYIYDYDELIYKNRIYKKFKDVETEAWVGRNLDNYISGIYWITLFSKEICQKYIINLKEIATELDAELVNMNDRISYLKLYDKPKDWIANKERIDFICDKHKGIFSINKVKEEVDAVSNEEEFNKILLKWK